MLKKFAIGLFALMLSLGAVACSNGEEKSPTEETPAAEAPAEQAPAEEAAPAEDAAVEQLKAVNAIAIAEDKVNTLFHHDAAEDGTPLLNAATGTPEAAKELLLGYFDAAVADRIVAHYVSAPATDAGVVVNAEKFFASSVIGVAPEQLTVEGTKADGFAVTTKDGAKYTVKWSEEQGRYIVANIE
jgi:Na+-transporting methylmalonyl-CoA/oxaloacetate decarboxylase gamma subunit